MNVNLPEFTTPVWIALTVVLIIELILLVAAWVKIARTPQEQVRFGSKLVWVLISLINGIGPIATLILVAEPVRVSETVQTSPSSAVQVADLLYGADESDSEGEGR